MPTPLFNQEYTRPWAEGEHRSTAPGSGPVGVRNYNWKRGARRLKTDELMVQIDYTRLTAYKASSLLGSYQWSYYPTPIDGAVPYITVGSRWDQVSNETRLLLTPETRAANNSAYEDFLSEFQGETSSLGVAAAEGREAFSMVANRVGGLYRSYKALRKGDFRRFLRELSVSPKRKHRNKVRAGANEVSGLWLEYWFGWAPTLSDLYSTAKVLSSATRYPSERVFGSSGCKLSSAVTRIGSTSDTYCKDMSSAGKYVVKTGATVTLSNPDLFLLNRLGLTNPATVAWELVPFSFVVDWFTSFGSVISGFTDLAGVTIKHPFTVWMYQGTVTGVYGRSSATEVRSTYVWNVSRTERKTVLLRPVTTRPAWLNLAQSQTRAATAVSLLTQLFLTK